MNRIKKGDEIIVITGKDKGRRGTVLSVLENGKMLVENVNVVKKHQKPNTNMGIQGGIAQGGDSIRFERFAEADPRSRVV